MKILNFEMDAIANLMNDEIRETVHSELAPCTDLEFVERYIELHEEKYNETFKIDNCEVIDEIDLAETYKAWRETSEEMLKDGINGSVDCGEKAVREDFTAYADLKNEITFEEMQVLEDDYKN